MLPSLEIPRLVALSRSLSRVGPSIQPRISVGQRLRPIRRLAGINLEKTAAIIAAGGTGTTPGDSKIVRGRAEMRVSVPLATFAVNGVEIVKFRNKRPRDKSSALLGRYAPPACARPDFAVEMADCHAHGLTGLIANLQRSMGRRSQAGDKRQNGKAGEPVHESTPI